MPKYRITREEYHNEYGAGQGPIFYIQEIKRVLPFCEKWVYIKHESNGFRSRYQERTKFKSLFEAKEFLKNILSKGKELNKHSQHIMGEYNENDFNE